MSLNKLPPFGSAGNHSEGDTYAMPSLPGTVEWPGERPGDTSGDHTRATPPAWMSNGRIRRIWQVLIALFLLFVVGAGGLLFYLDRSFAGLIYPNVSIRGATVGQMTPDAATAALRTKYAPFLQQPLTLTYGDRTWTPTPEELGVRLEIDAAVQHAFTAGRTHGLVENLREVAAVWQSGLEMPLHLTVDQTALQNYLMARAAEIEQPAVDAQLIMQGPRITSTPAASGHQVITNDTLYDITAALQALEPQTVALRTRELQPLLNDADVAAARQQVETLLQGPLLLKTEGKDWEWTLDDLAQMVQIRREPKATGYGDQLVVMLDQGQIKERLHTIAEATEVKGKHPRVDWNNGDLKIFRAGTSGRRMDEAGAEQMVMTAIVSPNRTIDVPFQIVAPAVTEANLDQLGIKELLAVGQSDFTGSAAYRVTNIKAGMNLLHGVLLEPGEEFSFNNTIGRIDGSNGFVEGYAIIQNRTQLEWGGGICQDSTTMFRAAFWAGLPITERWGHSFYINWYDKYGYGPYGNGAGMDATIFTGGPDLKFVNDTGNWLLIQTYVDRATALAEVRMYGTNPGRVVEMEGPTISNRRPAPSAPRFVPDPGRPRGTMRRSDTARGGMDITFTRVIKKNGAEVSRQPFLTRFQPWPNIYEVNPADIGPGGRPILDENGRIVPPEQPTPPADGTTPPADGTTPAPGQPAPPADGSNPAPPADGTTPAPGQPAPPTEGENPPPEQAPQQPPPNG